MGRINERWEQVRMRLTHASQGSNVFNGYDIQMIKDKLDVIVLYVF